MDKKENTPTKPSLKDSVNRWVARLQTPQGARLYALFSVAVLLASATIWAVIGARVHQGNADQLVDPYLFEKSSTFHAAQFPGQHTFLLKWPIFLLMQAYHFSTNSFLFFTVMLVLLTVGLFAILLYRIEKRPLVFGTLCLALASVLLLVPAQPYPGGILPVNMAMITTRNLEYIFYLVGLWLVAKSTRVRSWRYGFGVAILGLLIASDKLFLTLGIGGALLMITVYALVKRWTVVTLAVRWLLAMLMAALVASVVLGLINRSGTTHIVSESTVSPYGLVTGIHDFGLGVTAVFLGLATNYGANPADDYRLLNSIPSQTFHNMFSLSGLSFLVNFAVLLGVLFVAYQYFRKTIFRHKGEHLEVDTPIALSLMLLWSSAVAVAIYAFTNHYYPVDARYLSIALFAGFVSGAVFVSKRQIPAARLLAVGGLLIVSIGFALPHVAKNKSHEELAMAEMNQRNHTVVEVLQQHKVDVLVGDYWRVLPAKLDSGGKQEVMPLAGCTQARDVLTSNAWLPDLNHKSFAYLLSLDPNLTGSPICNLSQAVAAYGRPNASVVTAGTIEHPKEILLFYDNGLNKSAPAGASPTPTTVGPITLDQLPYQTCEVPTVFTVVAHQDDDILFMNPDLLETIKKGQCVRTVYVTAGDAGGGSFYWLGREQGAQAAYSKMLGIDDIWVQRTVKLANNQFITVTNPRGNSKVSLIFLHLPDGNVKGQGFAATRYETINQLQLGDPMMVQSVDKQSQYSRGELVDALVKLMHTYQPTEIRTQSTHDNKKFPDHFDHMEVSRLTRAAHDLYEQRQFGNKVQIPITFYLGYPVRDLPENVTGTALDDKETIFEAYSKFDGGVCSGRQACDNNPNYNGFLRRQYPTDR